MLDWKALRDTALRRGMQLMSDPRFMKLMSDPRVMKMVMQLFELRGTVQTAVDERVRDIAHRLRLVTEDEVASLKLRLRELESLLREQRPHATEEEVPE